MTPERRAKLRRTANYVIDQFQQGDRTVNGREVDLSRGLIECLDALEVQPIKDPYRELQAFLDEIRPDKPAPTIPQCRDGVVGCTVQHPKNTHAFVAPVPPGPPLTEHGSVCSCWSCNERTV